MTRTSIGIKVVDMHFKEKMKGSRNRESVSEISSARQHLSELTAARFSHLLPRWPVSNP